MTKTEILIELQPIFRQVFDDDKLVIKEDTSAKDIPDWDSLSHINLVSSIEKKLNVRFDMRDLLDLKDVSDMVGLIQRLKQK